MENSDIFAEFLFANFNASIVENSIFPSILKLADIAPIFKNKEIRNVKEIIDQLVSYPMFQRHLKDLISGNYQIIWNPSYPNTSVFF